MIWFKRFYCFIVTGGDHDFPEPDIPFEQLRISGSRLINTYSLPTIHGSCKICNKRLKRVFIGYRWTSAMEDKDGN